MTKKSPEMLSRMREVQRMEAERAELEQEKAKRELRRKFAQRKVGEGGFEINAERYEYLKYSQYCTTYFTTLVFSVFCSQDCNR